jgi:uncharacterized damage-inducible protein DinB
MQQEIVRILGQLRGSFEPGAWHGPSLHELLSGVTAELAAEQPAGRGHSIWELALHIAAWEAAARRMLTGGSAEVPPEQNFPAPAQPTEEAWRAALETVENEHQALLDAVASIPDARLDERVAGKEYSVYFLLHGVVQHNLYHAGQIALLKRILS